jgi:hypothetical protein
MDSQVVEIMGRNRLINELLQANLEVAIPMRDRGIDLIAYVDLEQDTEAFVARPIQMKAATRASFSISRKYERVRDLIIAFVWNLGDSANAVTYAMTYPEAVAIGEHFGWTTTVSWLENKAYTTNRPSKGLVDALAEYQMTEQKWRERITGRSSAA